MTNKIIRFPITTFQRKKNEHGKGYVPCIVSERWLQFSERTSCKLDIGEPIEISVMTIGSNDVPKKICDLIITREDLIKAIESIEPATPESTEE